MSSEFTLGDYVSLIRGTTYKGDLVNLPGPVLLGLASIQSDGGFRWGAFKTYGGACPPKITLFPGDLYVSLKDVTQSGDLLGSVARVPKQIKSGRLTQDTVKLELSGRPIDPNFLYWLLRTPQYRQFCRAQATGTTTLGLAREDFLAFPISDPTPSQISLVELLEAIEARIEILGETNATLEAIAQALFKSWFVDFDPVHANAGSKEAALPPEIQALFPSRFVESEQGLIPEGWQLKPLDESANFLNGLALQKFPPVGDEFLPVIKIAQLKKGDVSGADRASRNLKKEYVIQNGDVLFSWSGSLDVGIWCGGEGALNQHLFKVTSDKFSKWFYYLWTKHHLPNFREIAASKATTMGHIQRKHLTDALVIIPSFSVLDLAERSLTPLIEMIINNSVQAKNLTELRDSLLPRLISGKLRLPEVENELEDVV